jgi:aminopeptidase N
VLYLLSSWKTYGSLILALAFSFAAVSTPATMASNFQKIPIEQAIREAKESHEMERQMKIRQMKAQRNLEEILGTKGALPTQNQYDVHYYRMQMRVNVDVESVFARVDQMSTATQDNVTFCDIDLYANMIIDSVRVDNDLTTFTRNGNVFRVDLPTPVNTGGQFTVQTFYRGHPVEGGFQAFAFEVVQGQPLVSTLSEPFLARTWWPCKDYPDDKADSVDVIVTYPSGMFCTSNGTMVSDINNGDGTRTTCWQERYPIATYLVSLTMSDFRHWRDWMKYTDTDSMPVDFWVFPNDSADARTGYAPTVPMLDTLSRIFGLYPFINEKYGMTAFNWGGAMEHQTNTSIIWGNYAQSIIVHEMGHQWWGDMITCRDWHHIWMNEGFASYVEALWFESLGGFDDLRSYMNGMRYTSGGTIYCTDTTNVYSIFSSRVYDKGAWVLHMLRHVVGDDTFFNILRTYYADPRYKWKDVTSENFRDLCEEVSGMDLHGFFQDWIYGTYYPKYTYSYLSEQRGINTYRVYVHVRQTQSTTPTVFRMPKIDVSVNVGSYVDYHVPMLDREMDYVFDLTGVATPTGVAVDRNDWILKTATSESYTVHVIYDTLKTGLQSISYQDSVIVRGGSKPYTYSVTNGNLPAGLTLDPTTGVVSGTPTDTGRVTFTVLATATSGGSDSKQITMRIAPDDVHVISDTLKTGQQFVSYKDSVIARGGSKPYIYKVTSGSLPAGLTMDTTTGIVSGTPADTGRIIFTVSTTGTSGGSDSKQITMRIAPRPYIPGDANHDGAADISDAVYLIAFIFSGGPAPVPMAAGDLNTDCAVDVGDAVYLISYIFNGGPAPQPGC